MNGATALVGLTQTPGTSLSLSSKTDDMVSYNGGVSWSFENTVISYPAEWIDSGRVAMSDLSLVSVNDQTLLGVYFCNDEYEGGPRLAAAWIRALPVTSPEARERGL